MDSSKGFFLTYNHENDRHIYDLRDLGKVKPSEPIMSFGDGSGRFDHIYTAERPINQTDYDYLFADRLSNFKPIYHIDQFLDYHFETYLQHCDNKELWLNHVRYVILKLLGNQEDVKELIDKWLSKKEKMVIVEQLQQKNALLAKAYDDACGFSPSGPLSVQVNVVGIGEAMGYDLATTKRIITELSLDGYVISPIGLKIFRITREGIRYLERLATPPANSHSAVNINVSDNGVVQFQQGNTNPTQTLKIKEISDDQYLSLIKQIRDNLETITKYLPQYAQEDLVDNLDFLERTLKKASPDRSLIQTLGKGILGILGSVPGNVIANIITTALPVIG